VLLHAPERYHRLPTWSDRVDETPRSSYVTKHFDKSSKQPLSHLMSVAVTQSFLNIHPKSFLFCVTVFVTYLEVVLRLWMSKSQ
jgi:hypothetical protein